MARAEDVPPGEARVVEMEGLSFALFNVEGRFYVMDNTCLHRGGPLGEGFLEGTLVTCPLHGWQYDVRTGENRGHQALRVKTYPVTEVDGDVKIRVQG
ncbi:MAG: Rieske 2Fe-2S domain-containing protein [Thermoplasmata archaeon]